MFCTRVAWACLACLLLCKEEGSSPVSFAITERRDMGLYEVPLSVSLLGFGIGTMLANFHMCGIMLVLRSVFNILVRNASPVGICVLGARCLISQDLVSCYFYFVVLPLGTEKLGVHCISSSGSIYYLIKVVILSIKYQCDIK